MTKYRRIDHPAVAAVACPYCQQSKGTPCVAVEANCYAPTLKPKRKYVQTHIARVKKYEQEWMAATERALRLPADIPVSWLA